MERVRGLRGQRPPSPPPPPPGRRPALRGRPRLACRVAQRPALVPGRSRGGAIRSACSVVVPTGQSRLWQRHLRLCHTRRTGLSKQGRSTNSVFLSPSDHSGPAQLSHGGLFAVLRMWILSRASCGWSSTVSTSKPPRPTSCSQICVESDSTGTLQFLGCAFQHRLRRTPPLIHTQTLKPRLRPQTRRGLLGWLPFAGSADLEALKQLFVVLGGGTAAVLATAQPWRGEHVHRVAAVRAAAIATTRRLLCPGSAMPTVYSGEVGDFDLL